MEQPLDVVPLWRVRLAQQPRVDHQVRAAAGLADRLGGGASEQPLGGVRGRVLGIADPFADRLLEVGGHDDAHVVGTRHDRDQARDPPLQHLGVEIVLVDADERGFHVAHHTRAPGAIRGGDDVSRAAAYG